MKIKWQRPTGHDFLWALIFVIPSLLFSLFQWGGSFFPALLFPAATTGAAVYFRQQYLSGLLARVTERDQPEWRVQLNGITVGSVKDHEYAAIRLAVYQNTSIYKAQLLNMGVVVLSMANAILLTFPVYAFWGAVGFAIYDPNTLRIFLAALPSITPAEIGWVLAQASMFFCLFGATYMLFVGAAFRIGAFGFVNHFGEASNKAIRERLGLAATGNIDLARINGEAVEPNKEWAFIGAEKEAK